MQHLATILGQLDDRKTPNQWARILNVNPSTVWRWMETGCRGHRLPFVRVGNRRFVSVVSMEGFLAALNAGTADAETPAPAAAVTARRDRTTAEAARLGV